MIAAVQTVRDTVTVPRRQYSIMRNLRAWFQVASALDTIEDAQLAIESYGTRKPANDGESYLLLYGLLQSFILQQDAVSHLAEAIGLASERPAALSEIRQIRNDVSGHPTKRGDGKKFTTHTVVRCSLSLWNVTIYSSNSAGDSLVERSIDIRELIARQNGGIIEQMDALVRDLASQEREHMDAFARSPLLELFPQTTAYTVSKVSEGLRGDGQERWALANLEHLEAIVAAFREALTARGELPANEYLDLQIAGIDHPIARLKAYLSGQDHTSFDKEDGRVFLQNIDFQLDRLRRLAEEIDRTYENGA